MALQWDEGGDRFADAKLGTWDFVAIALYFITVIGAGLLSMCRSNRGTVSGYFLAGRFMTWLPVGASLFASNIGSEHFIGLAGSGAASGIAVSSFELNSCILLQLLGWVFLPVYIASGVFTLPEFMRKRFGGNRIRIYLASLSLLLYVFTKISVNLYSGALFIREALEWSLYPSVFMILLATAFCTVTGGLAAVIYTDTLQALVMVAGAAILTTLGFIEVGGFEALYEGYMKAIPTVNGTILNDTCGMPRADSWVMLRDPVNSDLPWPGFLLGQTAASIWYWCADQMMVQRTLAAKSLSHAQGGTLFAGYLKLLPLFIMVMPGMISRVLYTNEVACADAASCMAVCGSEVSCSNFAYPKLVLRLMPPCVMLSVMLAALMSDLTSIFNSASTLFTMDIYRFIRKKASVRELMIVGRVFSIVMVVIGIVWIPVIEGMQGGQLYHYIQAIAAYLSPPIAAIYLLAILWKRANEKGAFTGLMFGMVIGVLRMILDFVYHAPSCGEEDNRPLFISQVHYMYFALILFVVTGLATVIVSLLTEPPTKEQITRTTYWTRFDSLDRPSQLAEDVGSELAELAPDEKGDSAMIGVEAGTQEKVTAGGDDPSVKFIPEEKRGEVKNPDLSRRSEFKDLLKRGLSWFCGFDDSPDAKQSEVEMEEHIRRITNLEQGAKARIMLYIAMIILISTATFLFVFFSVGPYSQIV